jgi:hypothetical protein
VHVQAQEKNSAVGLQARLGILQNAPFHNTPHSRVNYKKRTNDSNPNINKQTRIKNVERFSLLIQNRNNV